MNILQMSISAGIFIVAIVLIRAVALNKLPKTMFIILWGIVLLRLIVPFSIPSRFSVYSIIDGVFNRIALDNQTQLSPNLFEAISPVDVSKMDETNAMGIIEAAGQIIPSAKEQILSIDPMTIIWIVGLLIMLAYFLVLYLNNYKELRFALPIRDNAFLDEWLAEHKLLYPFAILQSDRITTPIAVGIVKPRIILPKSINMDDKQLLRYILIHEYYHIKRFDTLWKLLLAFALCIHWFNPMVWVMFVLVNRDLELACDEMVVRHFGIDTKTTYAYTIISMAERRGKFTPLYNGFSKNAAEERITAIMKYKKTSIIAIVFSVILIAIITTACALGTAKTETNVTDEEINEYIQAVQQAVADTQPEINVEKIQEAVAARFTDEEIERIRSKVLAEYYERYSVYGLKYNKDDSRLYYNGQLVRYFEDNMSTDGGFAGAVWPHNDGVMDVHAVRTSTGELIGVEAYSQQEFDERTKDLENVQIEQSNTLAYTISKTVSRTVSSVGAGAPLEIPENASQYYVQEEDTPQSVAEFLGVSLDKLKALNPNMGDHLQPGQIIFFPQ